MFDHVYDFKFGWRWLLPLQGCRSVCLRGFDEDEQRFWRLAVPWCTFHLDDAPADAYLINSDQYKEKLSPAFAGGGCCHVSIVCVVGDRSDIASWRSRLKTHFPMFREYGLLPTRNPRVVVPLGSRKSTLAALGLHRPGRWMARLGVWGARLWVWLGSNALLRSRMLLVAVRNKDAFPVGAERSRVSAYIPESGLEYALYLGTMDENRKTVVLPIGTAEPAFILKVAELPKARQSLKNEAAALDALRESPVAAEVPKLRGVEDNAEALTLYQEFRPRLRTGRQVMDSAVIDFLKRLSTIDRRSRPLSAILDELADSGVQTQIAAMRPELKSLWVRLKLLSETGVMVWEHRSHGDFAPWNCAWTKQGFFVFDWEESKECDLGFSDAFYFVTSTAIHVQGNQGTQRTVSDAMHLAERIANADGLVARYAWVHLACWLFKRIDRSKYYGEMLYFIEKRWR